MDRKLRIRDHGAVKISEEEVRTGLRAARYVTTTRVETAVFVALVLEKPLLVEGPAGAGKTELAKVLAEMLSTELVRLQCYEGLDEARALYEWNYQKQLLRLQADRTLEPGGSWEAAAKDIFSREYLLERPLLRAITAEQRVVLLIDEVDKSDEEFEVSVPELGTIHARQRPVVVLTSNCTRELSEALKRRCLHLYVDFPGIEKEAEILALKVPEADAALRAQVARFVNRLRKLDLKKSPSIAETLDWCRALLALGIRGLDAAAVRQTLNLLLKHEEDLRKAESKTASLLG
jgi:MoxR-like ATPase